MKTSPWSDSTKTSPVARHVAPTKLLSFHAFHWRHGSNSHLTRDGPNGWKRIHMELAPNFNNPRPWLTELPSFDGSKDSKGIDPRTTSCRPRFHPNQSHASESWGSPSQKGDLLNSAVVKTHLRLSCQLGTVFLRNHASKCAGGAQVASGTKNTPRN